ncbi:MAG: sugar phosphate isomerase/epimerase [Kiritimatiellae bacterium]|nr:sugar phosphate isomerase/epimerase [Kiritimatiellia bacterium]
MTTTEAATETVCAWTADEITARLAFSISAFQFRKTAYGPREIAEVRAAGITRLELDFVQFDYRDRAQRAALTRECAKQGVTIVSFHGQCKLETRPPIHAEDEAVRKKAVREEVGWVRAAAEELGASLYVTHINRPTPATVRSFHEILDRTADLPLTIVLENCGPIKIRDAIDLVDRFGSARFKLNLDIGHEHIDRVNPLTRAETARAAVSQCGARLVHTHLHDTVDHDHYAPFHPAGRIQWAEVFRGLRDIDYQGLFLFELLTRDGTEATLRESLAAVRAFPERLAARCARE